MAYTFIVLCSVHLAGGTSGTVKCSLVDLCGDVKYRRDAVGKR